ncbi:MAG: DUF1905 domain-containing protein [Fimbriimonadaceae bacterium]|nr:DUF1905 domain-containing protein [Fimbriimonadaceae bacterium]
MIIDCSGEIFYWRGPAPFYFVAIPETHSREIKAISQRVTYGWGVIPVTVLIGETEWTTSLFPKDGLYLVPLKDKIRKAENLAEDETIRLRVVIDETPG